MRTRVATVKDSSCLRPPLLAIAFAASSTAQYQVITLLLLHLPSPASHPHHPISTRHPAGVALPTPAPLQTTTGGMRGPGARDYRASGLKIDFGKWRCRVSPHPSPPKPLTSNPPHISASHCLVCFTSRVKLWLSEGDQDGVEVEGGGIGGPEVILSPTRVWPRQVKGGRGLRQRHSVDPHPLHHPPSRRIPSVGATTIGKLHISVRWRFTSNDSEERVSRGHGAATRSHGPPFNFQFTLQAAASASASALTQSSPNRKQGRHNEEHDKHLDKYADKRRPRHTSRDAHAGGTSGDGSIKPPRQRRRQLMGLIPPNTHQVTVEENICHLV